MPLDPILTAIGFIGIGGLLKSSIDYIISIKKSKQDSRHILKETRYKAILLLSFAFINYETEKVTLIINRPDIDSIERLSNDLHAEFINMALYASDDVVRKMRHFLLEKDADSFNALIMAMRKDLYAIKTKLELMDFELG